MDVIDTPRLRLRPFKEEDLWDFYEYCVDPEVGPNAGWRAHADIEESKQRLAFYIAQQDAQELVWAIEHKDSGRMIGSLGLHVDARRQGVPDVRSMGYVMNRAFWGQGLMPEAVNAAMDHAFVHMGLKLLSVVHFSFNHRSRRVIEKCGFRYEGTMRMAGIRYDSAIVDNVCYSLTRDEYFELERLKK